jgi:ribose 5-phosphate isomerase B
MKEKISKLAIAADHAGFCLKTEVFDFLIKKGYDVKDFGTFSEESMDYPDVAHPLAESIEKGEYLLGILICGSGNGVSMAANKHINIRAALCWTEEIARLSRLHNNANILSLPARFISSELAFKIVDVFLNTDFEGGRHERRVKKI